MQEPEVGWDALTVSYHLDAATKLTGVYLAVSIVVFVILAIRFLPALARFKTALAALRAPDDGRSSAGPDSNAANAVRSRFDAERRRFRSATIALGHWTRLTVLILLGYSAVEIGNLFRLISVQKMNGVSALSGSLSNIFGMWSPALSFLAGLCVANWILSERLAHSAEV